MLFSSFPFLFWFLPLTLLLYFLPQLFGQKSRALAWQNAILLIASLLFYAWGEPVYVLLMLATVGANAALARVIPRARHPRFFLWWAILLDVGLLLFFKYLPLLGLPAPHLPLGISFYTFQALSYVADVYAGRAKAEENPFYVALYIALFPQLIAGPILRYTDVAAALHQREHSLQKAAYGVRRFAIGLAKKLLLANPMGALFAAYTKGSEIGAVGAWLALVGFALQIYFDFSGYSDMAIGLGSLFGFHFPENFNYPYVATSITDFWRRWHITLSSFFREYVYFPLGGNRRTSAVTVRNLLIVWLLTGLWHGAAWSFALWGLYYFMLLALEKFVLRDFLTRLPVLFKLPLTLLATLGGWLLFAFDGSTPTLTLLALPRFVLRLFGAGGVYHGAELYDLLRSIPLLMICALAATPLPKMLFKRLTDQKNAAFLKTALPLFLLLLSVAALADAGYNPFLYFRF